MVPPTGCASAFSFLRLPLRRNIRSLLQELDQLDIFIAKAEMMIEAERSLIGRAGTQRKNAVALLACPLLACGDQRGANTASFSHVTGRELVDVGLALARKVGRM